jgi:acetyltransferase-like isoleucine patch superfamily enzyme
MVSSVSNPFVHATATVDHGASIGPGSRIWNNSHVRSGSKVGSDCTIGFSVYVDIGVVVGDRCKVQNHVSLYRGVVLEDDVFVGPSATFTNDLYPRANADDWEVVPTLVQSGASIGANATIVCGVTIGKWAMIAAGAVVNRSVRAHELVAGSPARRIGWVCQCGKVVSHSDEPPEGACECGRTIEVES